MTDTQKAIKSFGPPIVFISAFLALLLFLLGSISLNWRYVHDSPLMIYAGWLITQGSIPYLDFFDMNMPGTYFVSCLMGALFGWKDLGFRIFDLLLLVNISASTFLWMRNFGKLPALTASVSFPLWYLIQGPEMSLQREYIALLPFSWLLLVATSKNSRYHKARFFLAGMFTAATMLIKPHFLILCLPVLIVLIREKVDNYNAVYRSAILLSGLSLPFVATLIYLYKFGALKPFVDIVFNYLPLYAQMTGKHEAISGLQRHIYLLSSMAKGMINLWLVLGISGLVTINRDHIPKYYLYLLGVLLTMATIYPVFSGQFWKYHWIPFYYVALCSGALSAGADFYAKSRWKSIVAYLAILALTFLLSFSAMNLIFRAWANDYKFSPPKAGVPDEISEFLTANLKQGDTVQPLDWTGGAVHGMLQAKAPLATRFMYDFHFYHHLSSPYIMSLRHEFVNSLSEKKPRFIVEILKNKPWPNGADASREFSELRSFLHQNYIIAHSTINYRIFSRKK